MSISRASFKYYTKAKAKSKRKVEPPHRREQYYTLCELYRCFKLGDNYDSYVPADKIGYEEFATEVLLRVIRLFNQNCIHSLKYGLRELDSEELEENTEVDH